MPFTIVKAHAFGNDFLLVDERGIEGHVDRAGLARAVCERHRGIGADGLIIYRETARGASMRLLNADGSHSEVSGNGVRCLGAWLASRRLRPERGAGVPNAAAALGWPAGGKPAEGGPPSERARGWGPARSADADIAGSIQIETEAGTKSLTLLACEHGRYTFRAAMGQPEQIALETIDVAGVAIDAVTLRVGNPQCVVLGEVTMERLHAIASRLAVHPRFPEGTNVELAKVEAPGRVRILIWERGVGPTEASGTGACAAAVAAMRYGGAARDVQVVSPGGAQRVEWTDDGLFLTGWAEVIAKVRWLAAAGARE